MINRVCQALLLLLSCGFMVSKAYNRDVRSERCINLKKEVERRVALKNYYQLFCFPGKIDQEIALYKLISIILYLCFPLSSIFVIYTVSQHPLSSLFPLMYPFSFCAPLIVLHSSSSLTTHHIDFPFFPGVIGLYNLSVISCRFDLSILFIPCIF